MVIKLMSLFC